MASGLRDSFTRSSVISNAMTPIGTFTKKIQRQDSPPVITPPRTGPTAIATPVTAPNSPSAVLRSRHWNA